MSTASEGMAVSWPAYVAPAHGQVRSAHYLSGFRPLIRDLGGNFRSILEESEISVLALENEDLPLSHAHATAMLESGPTLLNDHLFGAHLAEYQDANAFGCLTTLARSAPRVGAGLDAFAKFLPVFHTPGADLIVKADGAVAEFRWHQYSFSQAEQATTHGLLLALKFLRELVGADFCPSYVMSAADIWQRNLPDLEQRFGCKVHARSSASAIAFPSSLLDRPLRTADPIAFALVTGFLSNLKRNDNSTFIDQVKAQIGGSLTSQGVWTMKRCAARLGMSARALQKRLQNLGIQFSEIVETQRMQAAKYALLENTISLDEIASYLGYAEQSSFGRAFKRWTGTTPQCYRERRGDA